jgi:hypothetical protein
MGRGASISFIAVGMMTTQTVAQMPPSGAAPGVNYFVCESTALPDSTQVYVSIVLEDTRNPAEVADDLGRLQRQSARYTVKFSCSIFGTRRDAGIYWSTLLTNLSKSGHTVLRFPAAVP